MKSPQHIKRFVEPIGIYASILPGKPDGIGFVAYHLRCSCGNASFSVHINDRPLVIALCDKCGLNIVLYDTKLYPSACSYSEEGDMKVIESPENDKVYDVCVAYEYPEPDDNEVYTDDDISWCYIYGCPNSSPVKSFCIINDETA